MTYDWSNAMECTISDDFDIARHFLVEAFQSGGGDTGRADRSSEFFLRVCAAGDVAGLLRYALCPQSPLWPPHA